MDNDSIFYDAKRFDSVWKRVLESVSSPSEHDAAAVLKFMKDEYSDWQLYKSLAERTKGEAKRVFTAAGNDELRHFRALRTRYYILTGKTFTPGEKHSPPPTLSLSSVLRDRYEEESAGAAAYLAAAGKTGKPDIAEMYRRHSADETRHSRQMLGLINRIIG